MSAKYAVIDTESSGLFDFKQPADADGQPRLAQLAVILLYDDLKESAAHDFFIKPDGWSMQPEASAVNGLTDEILNARGVPVRQVLDFYAALIDEGYTIAAFNAQFDTKVMRGEMRRAGMDDRFEKTPNVCLMRASTGVCKVPRAKGNGYKFPKLVEACEYFKIGLPDAHSATGDVRAAAQILRFLAQIDCLPEATVHFAKNPPQKP